jgi:hypothetical protein
LPKKYAVAMSSDIRRSEAVIAGHVSQRMLAHYSHVRIEAKRKALDALDGGSAAVGHDTINDTKLREGATPEPQVLEKNGGDDGTRIVLSD